MNKTADISPSQLIDGRIKELIDWDQQRADVIIKYEQVINQFSPGEVLKLSIFRDGKPMEIDCKMLRREPTDYLVDPYMFDRGPRYQLLGGLLFQELTLNYLQLSGKEWRERSPFRLLYAQTNQEEFLKNGRRKLADSLNLIFFISHYYKEQKY